MRRKFHSRIQIAVLLALCGLSGASPAVSLSEDGKSCIQIKNDNERLSCFDQSIKNPESPATGGWKKQEEISALDRSTTIAITLNSEKSSSAKKPTINQIAQVSIVCREGKTSLFVSFQDSVAYGIRGFNAKYRIGSDSPVTTQWPVSQDHTSYGPFSSVSALPMLKKMISSDDFYVRGEDEVGGSSEAYFKLYGLNEAIKPIRSACKW